MESPDAIHIGTLLGTEFPEEVPIGILRTIRTDSPEQVPIGALRSTDSPEQVPMGTLIRRRISIWLKTVLKLQLQK